MNANIATESVNHGGENLNSLFPLTGTLPQVPTRMRRRTHHTMMADATRLRNCWVLNMPQAMQVMAHVTLVNDSLRTSRGQMKVIIVDPRDQHVLASATTDCELAPGQSHTLTRVLGSTQANVWSFDNQSLYQLIVTWRPSRSHRIGQRKELDFAFLEFGTEGVGQDAMFRMRNRKERLRAILPWSCWTTDGLTPVVSLNGVSNLRKN